MYGTSAAALFPSISASASTGANGMQKIAGMVPQSDPSTWTSEHRLQAADGAAGGAAGAGAGAGAGMIYDPTHLNAIRELRSQFGPITSREQNQAFQTYVQQQRPDLFTSWSGNPSFHAQMGGAAGGAAGADIMHLGIDQWGRGAREGYDPSKPPSAPPGYEWVKRSDIENYDLRDTASGQVYDFRNIPSDIQAKLNASNTAATGNATDGTTTNANTGLLDPSQSTLSPNFSQYVYNMLAKGEAAANLPFQPYTGERFAGPSALQQQAFSGLGALGSYTPTQFTSGYTPPALSGATQFGNQFTSPGAYTPMQFNTGLGPVGSVQSYMSPYLSSVTDIEAREARRQADISRNAEQARLAQAGAYGGSRQAIMEAERQRNLGTQIGDITSKGLQSAYDRAMEQRLKESSLGLEAQRGTETSRQFGAGQAMTAAQSAAQYGLAGLQEQERARQFQEQQRARGAEFGATQGLEAQRQSEASRQFGANYGLRSLADQLAAGATQREIAQQPLEFGYQQFQESMKYPYQQATYMQSLLGGLPLEAASYQPEQSALLEALKGGLGAFGLLNFFGDTK